jgi:hypothetical protein
VINYLIFSLLAIGAASLIASAYLLAGAALALSVGGVICIGTAAFIDWRF